MHEVTHLFTTGFQGYTIHYNNGTSRRVTAILTRDTVIVTNLTRIPSGRAIAATLGTLIIINVYAPCVNSKRSEREAFFNNDLPFLLGDTSDDILLPGDVNCVLEAAGSTRHRSFSRSLTTQFHCYALRDAWQGRPDNNAYTHHSVLFICNSFSVLHRLPALSLFSPGLPVLFLHVFGLFHRYCHFPSQIHFGTSSSFFFFPATRSILPFAICYLPNITHCRTI